MICPSCNGDRFLRRLVPHPGVKGCMVTVTKVCPTCEGKGKVPDSGNLFAEIKQEENNNSFSS